MPRKLDISGSGQNWDCQTKLVVAILSLGESQSLENSGLLLFHQSLIHKRCVGEIPIKKLEVLLTLNFGLSLI